MGFSDVDPYANAIVASQSKEDMISSFVAQTEEFIASLQDEGTFVSASETDEGDTNEKDNVRDGGYF